jgi:hypothetical protein
LADKRELLMANKQDLSKIIIFICLRWFINHIFPISSQKVIETKNPFVFRERALIM